MGVRSRSRAECRMIEYAARLARLNATEIEWLPGDNRYGLGEAGWRTFRFKVQGIKGRRMRRFYMHSSGFVVEGGRGGARIFEPPEQALLGRAVMGWTILSWPYARCPSIDTASTIVEALAGER